MASLKVYNGSSFDTVVGKTYNGTSWEDKMKFYDGTSFVDLFPAGLSVSPNTAEISYTRFSPGTVYATVQFNSNGTEYKNSAATDTGYTTSRGLWLDSGASSEVWINRIINSGTLNRFDAGAGRKILSTSRLYGISNTNVVKTTGMTFEFWDASSGGNLLDSVTYNLVATVDSF